MIFRAGCDSLPVVKPTSRGVSQSMIRCNSEADSIVWMKEDMDKQDLKDRFKRLVR